MCIYAESSEIKKKIFSFKEIEKSSSDMNDVRYCNIGLHKKQTVVREIRGPHFQNYPETFRVRPFLNHISGVCHN